YGSLMFPAVWQQLVPERRPHRAAFLPHYSRRLIFLDTYPLIIPDATSPGILGTLYSGLTAEDIKRLDWFEGELYQRINLEVRVKTGLIACETYVPKPAYSALAMQDSWRGDIFQQIQMPIFLARYCAKNLPTDTAAG
ncbi:MAG TPA: gamma-glutamylcyclotransferase, partial [Cellvibrionaceae bacterium]|nr:gamma-glutamylcyclotransferase [Cellvibrionaceae bacterium]